MIELLVMSRMEGDGGTPCTFRPRFSGEVSDRPQWPPDLACAVVEVGGHIELAHCLQSWAILGTPAVERGSEGFGLAPDDVFPLILDLSSGILGRSGSGIIRVARECGGWLIPANAFGENTRKLFDSQPPPGVGTSVSATPRLRYPALTAWWIAVAASLSPFMSRSNSSRRSVGQVACRDRINAALVMLAATSLGRATTVSSTSNRVDFPHPGAADITWTYGVTSDAETSSSSSTAKV